MRNDSCRKKNCDNCDRDRNGDEVHPTVILPKKRSIHPFVEVYRPLSTKLIADLLYYSGFVSKKPINSSKSRRMSFNLGLLF